MNYSFEYIDIILLAMIAGFIFLRLRGILGKRTGFEGKLSTDFKQEIQKKTVKENLENQTMDDSAKLEFLNGAKAAYEMIITSFAKGDKNVLKPLLNKEIFQNFSDEIDQRKKNNVKSELTFVGIKSAEIKNFEKKDNIYVFTVDFVSEIISCIKDKDNKVLSGDPEKVKKVFDTWKFSKDMWSNNPNWYLLETQA
tara:strand:+ start:1640 stop:2227 length:588 start_codon:yes stop_codon:yes gene_type:complete